ncbi:SLC13 family permease [Salarchaeum japonicum]|uniref:SLC13 family permease n=1 Tax=Salarchaeum japonicum TaxID=555573 RepID=UPI003C78DA58
MERRNALTVAGALALTALVAFGLSAEGLSTTGRYALATAVFAAVLWVTGALPLSVTALCVPILLTALGVSSMEGALSGFADPIVFLFLGTFVLASALRDHGIDRVVAFALLRRIGSTPRRTVFGVMLATAVLSMVISNTATAALMAPVALGIVESTDGGRNFRVAMLLGVAYAASVGGVATLIGTPPNAIVVGQLDDLLDVTVSFADWLLVGVPLAAVSLPVVWAALVALFPPDLDADALAATDHPDVPPLDADGRRVAAVFALVAGLWVVGGLGFLVADFLPAGWHVTLFGGADDSALGTLGHQGVLYYALVGLLAVPLLVLAGVADEDTVSDIDWPTLLLFGGGISLADALGETGATEWLAGALFGDLALPSIVLLLAVVALVTVALSELASNTATVAVMAPMLVGVGLAVGPAFGMTGAEAATYLAVGSAAAASFGFALPVATPPNAIVYGTGAVTRGEMLRAGVLLDLALVPILTAVLTAVFAVVAF